MELLKNFVLLTTFICINQKVFGYISMETSKELDDEFRKRFPYTIDGSTYENGPILMVPFGEWDIPKAIRQNEREKLESLYIEIFGILKTKSTDANGTIHSGLSIFDMNKYSLSQGVHPEANSFIIDMTSYFEKNYDQRILKKWYLINTPVPFYYIYNALKLILPENTREKWEVFGAVRYVWQWQLFKYVSPEQLPQRYGGVKDV